MAQYNKSNGFMRKIICFKIDPQESVEEAWRQLEEAGYVLLYSSEDLSGDNEIYAEYADIDKTTFPFVKEIKVDHLPEIDWDAQWEAHGADFKDGYVHLDLHPYGYSTVLKLQPGPGFGDLSHPTTQLVLEIMAGIVEGKPVLDVGSGSGVLSFAAEAMGAACVHGIDIDPEAIEHAVENAAVNSSSATFSLPGAQIFADEKECVILMNMIQSEQAEAWKELILPKGVKLTVITSGILCEGKADYLQLTESWGLKFETVVEKDSWCGFIFRR